MSVVTVSKKGWVVIPREIREHYGIRPGDKVQVIDYGGSIAIIPAIKELRQGLGLLKGGPSLTEDLLEEHRLEREREEQKMRQWD